MANVLVGFCKDELKLFTPVHENVPPGTSVALNVKVAPWHIGLLLVIVGAFGIAWISVVFDAILLFSAVQELTSV